VNNNKLVISGAAVMLLMSTGCGSLGGGSAAAPVSSRAAPLVVPPDFALAPAQTGAPRPQEAGQEQVLEAMFGGPSARSATERGLTTSAGTADAGIRSSVGDPQTNTVNKGSVTRDIIAAPEGDGQTAQAVIPG
jgi:Protein of unknown function (DUF3035)